MLELGCAPLEDFSSGIPSVSGEVYISWYHMSLKRNPESGEASKDGAFLMKLENPLIKIYKHDSQHHGEHTD